MPSTSAKTVHGVRISCQGDIDVLGAKEFIPVTVASSDPVFDDKMIKGDPTSPDRPIPTMPISRISELVDMPIRVRKIAPDKSWKNDKETGKFTNQKATNLLAEMVYNNRYLGFAPVTWQHRVGSVLVTSRRGRLPPYRIEALCAYTKWLIEGPMQEAKDSGSRRERYLVMRTVTPAAFEAFFGDYKAEKLKDDPHWADYVEPIAMVNNESAWDAWFKTDLGEVWNQFQVTPPD